ncbi:unnamed protein product [Orchesella dallaii]|uniref:Uncharacterized protein n=1 Tax=Orchesella dallaii TaxID=48710 RepID=A0ABP1QZY9_9HEXA
MMKSDCEEMDWVCTTFQPTLDTLWEVPEGSGDELKEPIVFREKVEWVRKHNSSWKSDSEQHSESSESHWTLRSSIITSGRSSCSEETRDTRDKVKKVDNPNGPDRERWRWGQLIPRRVRRIFQKNIVFPQAFYDLKEYAEPFGRSDVEVKILEWKKKLELESTSLDIKIKGLLKLEEILQRSIKETVTKGNLFMCRIYAKQILRSHPVVCKMQASKVHLDSIQQQLQKQLDHLKTSESIQKTNQIMKGILSLIRFPDFAPTMRQLSKDLLKVGILSERNFEILVAESLEEEIYEEAAAEDLDKIIREVTAGKLD